MRAIRFITGKAVWWVIVLIGTPLLFLGFLVAEAADRYRQVKPKGIWAIF